jgi:hypothetical protein
MKPTNSPNQNRDTPNCSGKSKVQTQDPAPQIPATVAPLQPKPPKRNSAGPSHREKDWWDKAKPYVEILGITLLAIYTGFTIAMYFANKEAADAARIAARAAAEQSALSRQTIVNTYGAEIPRERPSPATIPDDLELFGRSGIGMNFINIGKSPAHGFSADVVMKRETIPAYSVIGVAQQRHAAKSRMAPYQESDAPPGSTPDSAHVSFDTSMFTRRDIDCFNSWKETIEVSGTFQYENGFGEVVRETFCFLYTKRPQHVFIQSGASTGGGGPAEWFDCEGGRGTIAKALEWRRKRQDKK